MVAAFLGDGLTHSFKKTVTRILREYIDITEITQNRIIRSSQNEQFTVVFIREPELIQLCGGAIILNRLTSDIEINSERYFICNSADESDLSFAKKSSSEVITCGMSLRDSVTFSSFTDENCVISIQRSLNRFDGSKAEPFEFPFKFESDDDRYGILCANLLLILLGKI